MANISLNNIKTLFRTGKQIKTLFFRGKQLKLSYTVSFDTNIMYPGDYYYISGQSVSAPNPSSVVVPIGAAIGTLPSVYDCYYTLSYVAYYATFVGWYTDRNLTNAVSNTWVPTSDTTLYAKWKLKTSVSISTSGIIVPKFVSSVSWVCYSDGGSRSGINETGSNKSIDVVMAAPGADRNGDSYTWTGAIGGKTLTLAAQSMTLNGITRSVSTPGAGGTWHKSVKAVSDLAPSSSGRDVAAGSKIYTSGNYTIVFSWPKARTSTITISYYYANVLKGSLIPGTFAIVNYGEDNEYINYSYTNRTGSGTFSSGHYGAAGAYGFATSNTSSVSRVTVAVASGSGYYRAVTMNA